jgi:hypothetical protein
MKKKPVIETNSETPEFDLFPGRRITLEEAANQLLAGLSIEVYISYQNKWTLINQHNHKLSVYDEYFRVPEVENEIIQNMQCELTN